MKSIFSYLLFMMVIVGPTAAHAQYNACAFQHSVNVAEPNCGPPRIWVSNVNLEQLSKVRQAIESDRELQRICKVKEIGRIAQIRRGWLTKAILGDNIFSRFTLVFENEGRWRPWISISQGCQERLLAVFKGRADALELLSIGPPDSGLRCERIVHQRTALILAFHATNSDDQKAAIRKSLGSVDRRIQSDCPHRQGDGDFSQGAAR